MKYQPIKINKVKTNIITDEAKRFKAFRLALNLTLEEMGEILGRTISHVQKFEDGTRRIQLKDVKILHLKLGLSYEWFYHGKGSMTYKEKKEFSLKDISEYETKQSILENKVEQLDTYLKKLTAEFDNAFSDSK